jgi:hypothetical protein
MREVLGLFFEGEKQVGELEKNGDFMSIRFENGLTRQEVPFWFRDQYGAGKREFCGDEVEYWVGDRVVPADRQGINDLLIEMGLEKYNVWEVFKACRGRFAKDKFCVAEMAADGR